MSENMVTNQVDPITTLHSLITPAVLGALLAKSDTQLVAVFAIVSQESGVKESYIRASWRQLASRISAATSRKSSPRTTKSVTSKVGKKNSPQ